MEKKVLHISEDHPYFQKIRNTLIKQVKTEVNKIKRQKKKKYAKEVMGTLVEVLNNNGIAHTSISYRIKSKQSVIDKVIRKIHRFISITPDTSLDDVVAVISVEKIQQNILDLTGIRVVLKYKKHCYAFLDILIKEGRFEYLPDQISDYMKQPKSNNYQALHLVVHDKKTQEYIEIQIMTPKMLQIAETGEASRYEYSQQKGTHFFRNIALLAAAMATGGMIFSMRKKSKSSQKRHHEKKKNT